MISLLAMTVKVVRTDAAFRLTPVVQEQSNNSSKPRSKCGIPLYVPANVSQRETTQHRALK
jgi:hypothetical protein